MVRRKEDCGKRRGSAVVYCSSWHRLRSPWVSCKEVYRLLSYYLRLSLFYKFEVGRKRRFEGDCGLLLQPPHSFQPYLRDEIRTVLFIRPHSASTDPSRCSLSDPETPDPPRAHRIHLHPVLHLAAANDLQSFPSSSQPKQLSSPPSLPSHPSIHPSPLLLLSIHRTVGGLGHFLRLGAGLAGSWERWEEAIQMG